MLSSLADNKFTDFGLIVANYKGNLPHFEISVKFYPYRPTVFEDKKIVPYLVNFSLFGAQLTHFRIGRIENKEKRLF
jgi:hypothetical protein